MLSQIKEISCKFAFSYIVTVPCFSRLHSAATVQVLHPYLDSNKRGIDIKRFLV